MIEVHEISFGYGRHQVFIDFSINFDHNIFGFIGPNGAGKSTLLKLITGLLRTKSGDILVNQKHVTNQREEVLKEIGVLHENPVFPDWFFVMDHLLYVGQIRGLTRSESHVQASSLLKEFDLLDKQYSKVSKLSAGLKQRFGIAQAVMGTPNILLLDEPTANLDASSRVKILKFLRKLSRDEGVQIIIMSHVLSDLEKFCDGYAIIDKGKLLEKKSIIQLMHDNFYKEYTARFQQLEDREYINQQLEKLGAEIVDTNNIEILFQIKNKSQVENLNQIQWPPTTSVYPSRSLLEQVFLEHTTQKTTLEEVH